MTAACKPPAVHINRPSSTRFIAVARRKGHRTWVTIQAGKRKRTVASALMAAIADGRYAHGRLLLSADWYEPTLVLEVRT